MAKIKANKCNTSCKKDGCAPDGQCKRKVAQTITVRTPEQEQQMINNPVTAVKTHANNFDALYANYNLLRNLARPLNGLPQTDGFPDNVHIKNITITYELDGVEQKAEINKVVTIGEVAPLLSAALRNLIEEIQSELVLLDQTTTAIKNAVNSSRGGQKTPTVEA